MLIGGLGGNCKDVLVELVKTTPPDALRFYTDDPADKNIAYFEQNKLVVIKGQAQLKEYFESNARNFISLIGNNYAREKQAAFIAAQGGKPSAFISTSAQVSTALSTISENNVCIMHFTNISAGSEIKEGAVIYAYTAIAHDVCIGKYAFISAKCAISNSVIGDYTFVGLNTMVGPGVTIGKNCIIGANSYVKDNLPDNVIAAGTPAKIIRQNNPVI